MIAQVTATLPALVVIPVALLAMIVVAGHLLVMRQSLLPPSRRRIRTANAVLMLALIPTMSVALAGSPSPRAFVVLWIVVTWLLGLVLMLAALDVANSLRLHRRELRDLRRGSRGVGDDR